MTALALARVGTLYSGLLAAGLLLILLLIARFYQRQTQVRSGYLMFLLPAIAFAAAGARYAWLGGAIAGDLLSDLLHLFGGVCLIGWGAYVLSLMTARQK